MKDIENWPSRQDHYPAEKRAFDKNDYMDNKHFGKVVWAQLIALIIVGFICALGLFWLIVVIVNFFLQTKVATVTGIILFSCFSFTMGVGLILSAKR